MDPIRPSPTADTAPARAAVLETLGQVLADNGRQVQFVNDEDLLRTTLGLDSLDLAVLVVRLQQRLGVDPFRRRRQPVRTVGQLVAAYEAGLAEPA